MKLSAPKKITWMVAVVAGGLGILSSYVDIGLGAYSWWLVCIGFVLLAIGTLFDGV